MNKKEKQAWRTIVAVLQETGYDKLYDEEVHIVAECLRRCEQQCKKQKEVIDKAVLELVNIDGNLSNSQLSDRICNLIDILKEVSE